MKSVMSILVFSAILPLPHFSEDMLRSVVCAFCAWLAYRALKSNEPRWLSIMGIAAVLFNPFETMYLAPGLSTVASLAVGTSLFCFPKRVYRSDSHNGKMSEIVTNHEVAAPVNDSDKFKIT